MSMGFSPRFAIVGGVTMAVFERARPRNAVFDPALAVAKACSPSGRAWVVSGVRVVIEEGRRDYPRGSAWVVRRLCTPGEGDVYYSEDIVASFPSLEGLLAGTRDLEDVREMAESLEALITGNAVPLGSPRRATSCVQGWETLPGRPRDRLDPPQAVPRDAVPECGPNAARTPPRRLWV